jgi:hypothetical protein
MPEMPEQEDTTVINPWLNADFDQIFISGVDSKAYIYATYVETEALEYCHKPGY